MITDYARAAEGVSLKQVYVTILFVVVTSILIVVFIPPRKPAVEQTSNIDDSAPQTQSIASEMDDPLTQAKENLK